MAPWPTSCALQSNFTSSTLLRRALPRLLPAPQLHTNTLAATTIREFSRKASKLKQSSQTRSHPCRERARHSFLSLLFKALSTKSEKFAALCWLLISSVMSARDLAAITSRGRMLNGSSISLPTSSMPAWRRYGRHAACTAPMDSNQRQASARRTPPVRAGLGQLHSSGGSCGWRLEAGAHPGTGRRQMR